MDELDPRTSCREAGGDNGDGALDPGHQPALK